MESRDGHGFIHFVMTQKIFLRINHQCQLTNIYEKSLRSSHRSKIIVHSLHSTAVGSLNRKLSSGQGRANALYVLFYYMGGWLGITLSGFAYKQGGWSAVIYICLFFLVIPLSAGIGERKNRRRRIST